LKIYFVREGEICGFQEGLKYGRQIDCNQLANQFAAISVGTQESIPTGALVAEPAQVKCSLRRDERGLTGLRMRPLL
jgi:hypothetical protein